MHTMSYADGVLTMIDQTKLPHAEEWLAVDTVDDLVAAIQRLSVRGAPALGVAGAYGVAIAARAYDPLAESEQFDEAVRQIREARPTAVNLAHMVDRVHPLAPQGIAALEAEADKIRNEELASSLAMGDLGADLALELSSTGPVRAMTICNTGGLATVARGTALAVIQALHERGQLVEAIPLETRPLLQGSRLTTWELARMGAPHRLIVDSAAASLLAAGGADVVLIGADRVVANGDTANKIGSFSLALAAAHAKVPFIVVAPETTVDMSTATGEEIEIELRGGVEVTSVNGHSLAPDDTDAINPAFDVTPVSLITALVTDTRVVRFDQGQSL